MGTVPGWRWARVALIMVWVVVAASGPLLWPASVAAAANWSREVRFSEFSQSPVTRWQWSGSLEGCSTATSVVRQDRGDELVAGTPVSESWVSDSGGAVCRAANDGLMHLGVSEDGTYPYDEPTPGQPITEVLNVRVYVSGHQWAPGCEISAQAREYGSGGMLTGWVLANPRDDIADAPYVADQELLLPIGTRALMLSIPGACSVAGVLVEELGEAVAGDCSGVAGAGGDAGLVIPASGLTTVSGGTGGWGDLFLAGSVPTPSCLFEGTGHYRYVPPEGLTAGDTHIAGVEIASASGEQCRAVVSWGGSTSGGSTWLNETHVGGSGGAAGPGHFVVHSNVPATGATRIDIVFTAGCRLHGLLLANIEGDPVQDNGADGTDGPSGSGGPNPFADCVPGSDFLAVGEWVAYAACLILGLPAAIGGFFVGILRDLFIPGPGLAAQFDRVMDKVTSRVPFGWFAEVVTVMQNGLGAAASQPVLSFSMWGGVGVNVDGMLDEALGALAPYRGWLAAGVWFIFAQNVHYMLMSATGAPVAKAGKGS